MKTYFGNGGYACVMLMDLSKTFDTLNNKLLMVFKRLTHSHNWKATKVIDNNGLVLTTVYLVLGKRYL